VEADDGWQRLGGVATMAISSAIAEGRGVATFEARGFLYQLNLVTGVQQNIQTGRRRRLRQVGSASPLPSPM